MAKFFTVDRRGYLHTGMELHLTKHTDIIPQELQSHVDMMFPDGVSRHGDQYFLGSESHAAVASPAIELLFEYVRRAHFPYQPSRFKSFFAVETFSEAELFNQRYGEGKGTIWEIEATGWFRANMNLLTSNQTNLVFSYFAHSYWRGEPGPDQPLWEMLLTPPVRVLAQVLTPPLGSVSV